MSQSAPKRAHPIDDTDRMRAGIYRLLARLLARPADADLIALVAGLGGDQTEMGQAIAALAKVAAETTPEAVQEEYDEVFIGVGRGLLVPYASYYLTGFLNDKPLARLRIDMERLGIARAENVVEPEDHVAALLEMMAGLIEGGFAVPASDEDQAAFFETHVVGWMPHFFADLEKLPQARFHGAVGRIGRLFVEIEKAAFEM